jgi:monoamine oxidase
MNRFRIQKNLKNLLSMAHLSERLKWSDQQFLDSFRKNSGVNRRAFVKGTAAGLATVACYSNDPSNILGKVSSGSNSKIVIVGSGLAGLTAAYYLNKQGIQPSIYEARNRIGGRVITQKNFNQDKMFIEWGAEFVDSSHKNLIELASELGLTIQEFASPMNDLEPEIFYFNNRVIDSSLFLPEFRQLAKLVIQDTAPIRKNGQIVLPTFGDPGAVPWLDQISLAEYLNQKIEKGLSKDFVELINVMYLGMLGLETTQQSVYNLLTLMDVDSKEIGLYGDSDESKRVLGGNGNIVMKLSETVGKHSSVNLEHQLTRISKTPSGAFLLDFTQKGGPSTSVRADTVIMTVPLPVLREVEGIQNLNLSKPKKNAIMNLGYATNSKYSLGFKKRIWREKGNNVPPNYGTVWSNNGYPEVRDSSNNQPGQSGIILNYLSGKQGLIIDRNLRKKTIEHLAKFYPQIGCHLDGNEHLQHWSAEPYSKGSYPCPNPRHYELMAGYENQSELNSQLIFAGDAFSEDFGGYMNGAIQTGKIAAELAVRPKKS